MAARDCAAISQLGAGEAAEIYVGLGAACFALAENSAEQWKMARDALTDVGSAFGCQDRLALGLLADLVHAHEIRPEAPITIVEPTVAPDVACR